MDILFCAPDRVTNKLGAPKVYLEISSALQELGCTCEIVGREDVAPNVYQFDTKLERNKHYSQKLKGYIHERSSEFDVIEYEHEYLPFPRSSLPSGTLLVARSVLLAHHARDIRLPVWKGIPRLARYLLSDFTTNEGGSVARSNRYRVLKKHLGEAFRHEVTRHSRRKEAARATATCSAADLVFVTNASDQQVLRAEGIRPEKTVKLPFGMTQERYQAFSADGEEGAPTIIFVGTYDFRKGGATDLPRIIESVLRACPAVQFRLLGTKGLFVDEKEVLAHFSADVHDRVNVIPEYSPDSLPELLRGGTLGIFPSYFEGFPFGVLEMQAAGLPVIAYDAPGPPEMLSEECLVPLGHWKRIAQKAVTLLKDRKRLEDRREEARRRAKSFQWEAVAQRTLAAYEQQLQTTETWGQSE